ncbi:glycosyltransferase [Pontibacter sp. JH31]|uniref:Glycosyltransferase n=1 Tax=Pontibacter aquaedesilientis TaxID=2766980 RepID=A0ABR7XKW5_9BACT|nr:glycosyltransferase [Pontibacter aquaedesilientis]MBD1398051.1 glycosyltransferase [Pontibacter aquaedesilientis]
MNVFVIPSWYPSKDHPTTGIMIAEQYEAISKANTAINIGVSIWGQMDNRFLLKASDHLKNLPKLTATKESHTITKSPNLKVYHTPAFTWSRKLFKGNFDKIVKANLRNLKAFERDFGPVQLLHAHVGHPAGNIALEVARQTNLPFCLTEHMGPFPSPYATNKQGLLTAFHRSPYMASAVNIAVSPFQKKMMEQQGISNIVTVSNFIDEDYFQPAPPLPRTDSTFTFFTFTRLVDGKGIEDLLHATKALLNKGVKVRLRIGGTGQKAIYYRQLAEGLEISEKIEWLGELSREAALWEYQKCDAFVLPSYYESFGIVYIEALACGKPIIATKCGGPETIVNELNGLLIDKGSPVALAEAMQHMTENAGRYDSAIIRQDFLTRFSKKTIIPQLVALYQKVITQHKSTL